MRSRKKVEEEYNGYVFEDRVYMYERIQIEILLDIRDLLKKKK